MAAGPPRWCTIFGDGMVSCVVRSLVSYLRYANWSSKIVCSILSLLSTCMAAGVHSPGLEVVPGRHQPSRAEQAADMIGAERRDRTGHGSSSFFRADASLTVKASLGRRGHCQHNRKLSGATGEGVHDHEGFCTHF